MREFHRAASPRQREINRLLLRLEDFGLNLQQTQTSIANLIDSPGGGFVGRPGGTESVGLEHFIKNRLLPSDRRFRRKYPRFFRDHARSFSGIIAHSDEDWDFFSYSYLRAALSSTLYAFGRFAPGALGIANSRLSSGMAITNLGNLEPWHTFKSNVKPWTKALEGKKVLVVHPFVRTISSQFERKGSVSGVNKLLPDFELVLLRPPVTVSDSSRDAKPWRASFEDLVEEVQSLNFDVAIVAAGSYGLPLAEKIANRGLPAIHMGGSLQLLFGISGSRWRKMETISSFIGSGWVEALEEDRFSGLSSIEGGSYT